MARSRKDNKGYALRTGETQRLDGRYCFSYTDLEKKRHYVYTKTLAELRKKERKIIHDIEEGLDPHAAEKITLNQMFDRYISTKCELKNSTMVNYCYMYNHFVRNTFGQRKLKDIRYYDVKKFYLDLIMDRGIKANTLENIHKQIFPALQLAVRDGFIRVNPAVGVYGEIKKSKLGATPKKRALTIAQQKALVDFLDNNKDFRGWYPIIIFLLGTGCRIGETVGLRWEDIDFKQKSISINHNTTYRPTGTGTQAWQITTPKTQAGNRTIPLISAVEDALAEQFDIQMAIKIKQKTIDGYTGFIFVSGSGYPVMPHEVNRAIASIIEEYNKKENANARIEKREANLLPHFSAHNLRHTFCTRLCENESNLKVIQSIMGHSDISTTMDIYAEATEEKKQETIANLENKIIIR